jgi:quinol monooxygenase YgiN
MAMFQYQEESRVTGLEIFLKIEPDKRKEFLQTFMWASRPDKRPVDCLGLRLFEDVNQPDHYIWVEHWTDSKKLENHMQTERFFSFLGAIEVLGALEEMRTVTVDSIEAG